MTTNPHPLTEVELLPCPFCGNGARSGIYARDGSMVCCANRDCHASVLAFNPDARTKAIDRWNTRTPSPVLDEIDLFRIIRAAGRSNVSKAKAVFAALYEAFARHRLSAQPSTEAVKLAEESAETWFKRNADRRRPDAFINTDPAYFASECADAIAAGALVVRQSPPLPSIDEAPLAELQRLGQEFDAADDVEWVARAIHAQSNRNLDADPADFPWEETTEQCRDWNRACARAAIAALTRVDAPKGLDDG